MRSASSDSKVAGDGDRTAKARIRDAAIECFAEHGIAGTTARKVATAADVSPGLVMHHFGSMEGLRMACNEHVARSIREQKSAALTAGPGFDILAALRNADTGHLARYLAKILVDDSPIVEQLVEDLVADAEGYIQQGVEAGTIVPSDDPRGRAVVLVLWTLGGLVLHEHMGHLLGVDLTDPLVAKTAAIAAYAGPAYEVLGGGFFTDEFAQRIRDDLDTLKRVRPSDSAPSPGIPDDGRPATKGRP